MDSVNAASAASTSRASSLVTRFVSGIVLLVIIVGFVYWGKWPVVFLTALGILIALFEYLSALKRAGYRPRNFGGITTALLLCGAATLHGTLSFDFTGAALAISILLGLFVEVARRNREGSLTGWALTFAGSCYISWPLSHYILLRGLETPLQGGWLAALNIDSGAAWIYLVLAITWFQDTGAYLVGRKIGRHRMAPYLSPKKSWEGAIGGFLASIVAALLAKLLLGLPLSYPVAALVGAIGGLVGPIGDLAESLMKRQIGVKDASNLIPGHGGVLDRADSMLFTGPVIYYLVLILTALSR